MKLKFLETKAKNLKARFDNIRYPSYLSPLLFQRILSWVNSPVANALFLFPRNQFFVRIHISSFSLQFTSVINRIV